MSQPIKKFKAGAIEASIWENKKEFEGTEVGFKTLTLRRSWRDKKENMWRDQTINLRKADLAKTIIVLQKAQEYLLLNRGDDDE